MPLEPRLGAQEILLPSFLWISNTSSAVNCCLLTVEKGTSTLRFKSESRAIRAPFLDSSQIAGMLEKLPRYSEYPGNAS